MTTALAILVGLLAATFAAGPALASSGAERPDPVQKPPPHARVNLVCETTTVKPGAAARLGLLFDIDKGWHIYWNGFTTSGMPPTVEWKLPKGVTASEPEFPAPKRHVLDGDILDHIYEGRVLLPVTITVPATARPGEKLTLAARIDYLVCEEVCIAERADVELTLTVSDAEPQADGANAKDFAAARPRLPRSLPSDGSVRVEWTTTGAAIIATGAQGLVFYPARESTELSDPIKDAESRSDRLTLRIETDTPADAPLSGVLEVRKPGAAAAFYLISVPRPATTPSAAPGRATVPPKR